jgi:hypothetical protein
MEWQANPYSIALLLTAFISAALAVYAWPRHNIRGAIFLIALMVAVTEWSVGYAIELGEPVFASKITWAKLEYFGIVVVPVAWFLYAIWFTGRGQERSRRYWSSLLIIPICTLILVWTNELHGLIWSEIRLVEINRTSMFDFSYGPGFWLHTLYSYALVMTGSVLIVRYYFRSQGLYRQQARVILVAALVPWLSNAIYIFGFNPFPELDLTPFGFTMMGLLFAWGLLRLQLLDISLARARVSRACRSLSWCWTLATASWTTIPPLKRSSNEILPVVSGCPWSRFSPITRISSTAMLPSEQPTMCLSGVTATCQPISTCVSRPVQSPRILLTPVRLGGHHRATLAKIALEQSTMS